MKLYTYPGNKNAFKALIVAQYAGLSIEQPAYQWGVTNRTDEFLKLFPLGKVPALETPEGGVFESNAIARYLARAGGGSLLGSTPYQQALVDQWVEFATNEVDANVNAWLQPLKWPSYFPHHAKKEEQTKTNLRRALTALEAHLAGGRAFLVGDSVTLADIILVCNLHNGFTQLFDPAFRADFPNVERYFLAQVAQPQFHAVIGDIKLAEQTLEAATTA